MAKVRAFGAAGIVAVLVCFPRTGVAQTAAPSGIDDAATPFLPSEDTLETPFTLGMGAGARAGATGTSALAYNASNMGATRAYHVEAFSQIIPGGGNTYWTVGSSVTDSTTAKRLALGTSFRGIFSGEDRQYRGWDWRTGLGIQAIDQLGLGLGVRWGRMNAETVDGQPVGPSFNGVTIDASLTLTPIPMLKLAALGYNLVRTRSTLAPQTVGGSAFLVPVDEFSVGADVLVDLSTFERNELLIGVGVQFIAAEMVPLRFGYRRDNGRDFNQITAGAGFNKGRFGVEASIRQTVGSFRETYLVLMTRFVVR